MTVEELVERYLSTRIGVKPNTKANYKFLGRQRRIYTLFTPLEDRIGI